jgi:acetyl esterase/lipase
MGLSRSILLLGLILATLSCPAASSSGARSILQASKDSMSGGTPASSKATSQPAACTQARSAADASKPFCAVSDTASPGARAFLSQAAAGAVPWNIGNNNATAIAGLRRFFENTSINSSAAAVATYLESTRNDTIAGVPVVFGILKNANKNTKPADTRLLIYLHGGGYVIGSCQYQWSTAVPTAARAGLTTLCIEYRLAPEHPFPAGLNDVLSVYKELLKQGYKAKNLVLLGDSAGGGMVAAVAIQLRREGVALPAALGMFSPWADPDPSISFDTQYTLAGVDPILPPTTDQSSSLSLAYVGGNAAQFSDPLVSPRRADWAALFPSGTLPPTLIQVGLRETLLSQDVLLYHNMKKAAPAPGHVSISPYDVVWHVFQAFFTLPEAQAANNEMGDFMKRALNGAIGKC